MMYLMLSVAGHLTIFQTRTRGPWWSTRPAQIVLAAVCGTQAVATLIAVYGAGLVTPLGWKYAGVVWGYAFAWFLVTDPMKLVAYKVLDAMKTGLASEAAPVSEARRGLQPPAIPQTLVSTCPAKRLSQYRPPKQKRTGAGGSRALKDGNGNIRQELSGTRRSICSSKVKRVIRSTKVPTAELPRPR